MADRYYLQFKDNAVRTTSAVFVDLDFYQPEPGEILIEWEIQNDDRLPGNYRRDSFSLVYDPPAPPTAPPRPDVDAMLTAIWDHPFWDVAPPRVRAGRPDFASLAEACRLYLAKGEISRIHQAWADKKLIMPQQLIDLVEGFAAKYNVPLISQSP